MCAYRCLLSSYSCRAVSGFGAAGAFLPIVTSNTTGPSYPCHLRRRNRLLLLLHRRLNCSISSRVKGVEEEETVEWEQFGWRSPSLVALEYAELNLSPNSAQELGALRVRQHVNPLRSSLSMPAQLPDWNEVFRDPKLPLTVDIGSGSGRFLLWLAKNNPNSGNYLGLEIRDKLVKRADIWVKELALDNIHFIFANATVSFEQLVSAYPGPLTLVSILCPDPHFKKRHHKRRVLQKPLVDSIIKSLQPGGKVFVQSDVLEVALDMRNQFDAEADMLQHIDEVDSDVACDGEGWISSNPMGIRTEREIHAQSEGAQVYRRLYLKKV